VRFEFREIVDHPDLDLVLRTLKHCMRDVSLEIVQAGEELTIYGLGPSFRTMNRNDRAIFRASSQGTATLVQGDVNFLASALMGDIPQDTAVRSKIEHAIRCVRAELHPDSVPQGEPTNPYPKELRPSVRTEAFTPAALTITSPASAAMSGSAQTAFEAVTRDVNPQMGPVKPVKPIVIEPRVAEAAEPSDPAAVVTASSQPSTRALKSESVRPTPLPSYSAMNAIGMKYKRSAILPLAILSCVFVVCVAYLLQHRSLIDNVFTLAQATATQASSVPAQGTVNQQLSSPAPSAQNASTSRPSDPKDIKTWVAKWAAVMSTGDAEAQVSFYTDPVNRYFLRSDVSRDQLLRTKQSEIEGRRGLWTIKAEDVVIDQQTGAKAVIRLRKHVIVKLPSSSIREERIKTQLKLKLIDGSWKIISERTLG
jgi:hypothetical protein